ncbi:MAG TPA: hypothetical protein VF800_05245 [Telluria sp.]
MAAVAGALLLTPAPGLSAAPAAKHGVAYPHARYTVMPAQEAIKRFKLMSLLSPLGRADQDVVDDLNDAGKAIVFEGDVRLEEDVEILSIAASKLRSPFETALIEGARLIVVNGDLHCRTLSSDGMSGIFVLGNVDCDAIFFAVTPFYAKGNVVARRRLLASGDSTDAHGQEGEMHVRVDGTVFAPKIRSWYFRLGHLKFAKGAAREFIVDGDQTSSGPCTGDKNC